MTSHRELVFITEAITDLQVSRLFLAISKMPRRCVAALCDKSDSQLYVWRTDQGLAKLWTRFVRTKRDKWTPSATSVLCSSHLSEESFTNLGQFRAGLSKK